MGDIVGQSREIRPGFSGESVWASGRVISVGRYPYGRCETVGVLVPIVATVVVHVCLTTEITDRVCDCMVIGSRCSTRMQPHSVTAFDVTAPAAVPLTFAPSPHLTYASEGKQTWRLKHPR